MFKKINFNFFKKKPKAKDSKLSLPELVWFGFNYTVGIAFTAVFASLLYGQVSANLGTHMIWIFLIEGLIAGTCAWAFARLSQVHPPTNGAAYIYTRSSYGRFWGLLIAFLQYTTLPIIITSQAMSMIRINFTTGAFKVPWGIYANLGLDLIGILIYALISCVLFFGMKAFKYFVNISGYIKWITTIILIIAVIALFAMSGTSNYETIIDAQQIDANSFSKAFSSCFFFFLGFETFTTMGKNVQNPQKNISRSIVIVMALSTLFYVFVIALMIGSATTFFDPNPNIQVFEILGKKIGAEWFGLLGGIVMLICVISLKGNAQMQNAFYGGTMLEPLAVEGFIPTKYNELNKDKIPFKASLLNIVIALVFLFIWLIIPDVVQVITDSKQGLTEPSAVIDFSTITGETSLIMILVYMCVVTIALKLSWQKKLRHNKFEFVMWVGTIIFLAWQCVMWFVNLGNSFASAVSDLGSTDGAVSSAAVTALVSNSIQIFYLVVVFAFALIWYRVYYLPKLRVRLVNKTQEAYDKEFLLQDDWSFVAKGLEDQLNSYLERNVKILGTKKNDNYQFAKKVHDELVASEAEWKDKDEG